MPATDRNAAKRTIIFVHVPKTAGTTIRAIIAGEYSDPTKVLLGPGTGDQLHAIGAMSPEERNEIEIIAGHVPHGFPNLADDPRYCTLLREPIDRVVSFYYYVRREPEHYLYEYTEVAGHTLREVIEARVTPMMDNFQTRLISGVWNAVPFGEMTEEFLERAKANLATYDVVGLQERFDESLLLLAETFGWSTPYYSSRNVSEGRPRIDQLDAATRKLVADANVLDMELYAFGKDLFERRLRAEGPAFARRVERFRRKNRNRGRLRRATLKLHPRTKIHLARVRLQPLKHAVLRRSPTSPNED